MKLLFSQDEQMSIRYLVQALIKADGLVLPEENVCWNTIALKLGWELEKHVFPADYELNTALAALAVMDEDKKRFASAFFTMIILADEQIAPEEAELFRRISEVASLPAIPHPACPTILNEYTE